MVNQLPCNREMIPYCPEGPGFLQELLKGERKAKEASDVIRRAGPCQPLLALKMEGGGMSQGMWVHSQWWGRRETDSP